MFFQVLRGSKQDGEIWVKDEKDVRSIRQELQKLDIEPYNLRQSGKGHWVVSDRNNKFDRRIELIPIHLPVSQL